MPSYTTRINATKPDQGNTNWKTTEDAFKDKVDEMAAQYIRIPVPGEAVDETVIFNGFKFDAASKVTKISIFAGTAPTGANLTIDLLKDGTEQTKIATLTAGATDEITDITDVNYATTEKLGLKIKSVGSTQPGSDLIVTVHHQVQAIA